MEIENLYGKKGRTLKLSNEVFDDMFEIPKIMKKIEDNKELTREEIEKILQYIKKKSLENKRKSKNILPVKGKISFKFLSLKGRIAGKRTKSIVRSAETIVNLPKDITTNSNEVLKGVKITSDNMCPENLSTLLLQYNTTKDYLSNTLTVIDELSERMLSPVRDYETPIAEKEQDKMEEEKKRVKSLGQQYQRNKGKR